MCDESRRIRLVVFVGSKLLEDGIRFSSSNLYFGDGSSEGVERCVTDVEGFGQ